MTITFVGGFLTLVVGLVVFAVAAVGTSGRRWRVLVASVFGAVSMFLVGLVFGLPGVTLLGFEFVGAGIAAAVAARSGRARRNAVVAGTDRDERSTRRRPEPPPVGLVQQAVFVSYRRSDTGHAAARIADRLVDRLGDQRVFIDIDSLGIGDDFPAIVLDRVRRSAVVLVVIGPDWLDVRGQNGVPRLRDPADYVRIEVETALRSEAVVVPVLVDGAVMPASEQLPPSLAPLSRRHAARVNQETFAGDSARIVSAVAERAG